MIDFKFLERLLELLNSSEAHTIEIRKRPWSTSIKVSKSGSNSGAPITYQVAAPAAGGWPVVPPSPPQGAPVEAASVPEAVAEPQAERELIDIKSPMVGTFYARPEPGADPYVREGARISVGTTLCIIEAMKIMNPLDSEVTGVIVECLVEDAQPVEFGQVLFRVDPNG